MEYEIVGELQNTIIDILGLKDVPKNIKMNREGLKKHLLKRKHSDALPYFDKLQDILRNPDYVGVHPQQTGTSVEYIKRYDENVLIAIKLHETKEFFYIPTMYIIKDKKVDNRIFSGRLKKLTEKK